MMNRQALQDLLREIGASIKTVPPYYFEERIGMSGESEIILTTILDLGFERITQEPEPYSVEAEIGLVYLRTVQEGKIKETRKTTLEKIELRPAPGGEVRNEVFSLIDKEVRGRVERIFDGLILLFMSEGKKHETQT